MHFGLDVGEGYEPGVRAEVSLKDADSAGKHHALSPLPIPPNDHIYTGTGIFLVISDDFATAVHEYW